MAVTPDDVAALFLRTDAWNSGPYDSSINSDYVRVSTSHSNNSHGFAPLSSDTSIQATSKPSLFELGTVQPPMETVPVTLNNTNRLNNGAGRLAAMHVSPHTGGTPQAGFVAMNSPGSPFPNLNTISPVQVCSNSQSVSASYVSLDSLMRSPTVSSCDRWSGELGEESHQQKRRRRSDITHSNVTTSSTTKRRMGRRRASENVELGSARAIYLEKNRKAASKCRNKQKVQQEELAVAAREHERKNRVLKAEVDLLKTDIRHLMEVVGQHARCPDRRLQLYIQHEADRLSAMDKDDPVAQILSSKDRYSPEQS